MRLILGKKSMMFNPGIECESVDRCSFVGFTKDYPSFHFQEIFEEIKLYGIILSCFIGNSKKQSIIGGAIWHYHGGVPRMAGWVDTN